MICIILQVSLLYIQIIYSKIYEIGNFIKQLICTNKINLLKQFLHQVSISLTFARKWKNQTIRIIEQCYNFFNFKLKNSLKRKICPTNSFAKSKKFTEPLKKIYNGKNNIINDIKKYNLLTYEQKILLNYVSVYYLYHHYPTINLLFQTKTHLQNLQFNPNLLLHILPHHLPHILLDNIFQICF